MSIITAVEKDGRFAICCDTQVTYNRTIVSEEFNKYPSKIFNHGGNYFGNVGWLVMGTIVKDALLTHFDDMGILSNEREVFQFAQKLHSVLKEHYFLMTTDQVNDQPVESSQSTILVVNDFGIFTIESYRDVIAHKKFCAIGCGEEYALGAMDSRWGPMGEIEDDCDASEVAIIGVNAACKFDNNCGLPLVIHEGISNKRMNQ